MGADASTRHLLLLLSITMRNDEPEELTPPEIALVRLLSLGCTVKQAAAVLDRSWHTIDNQKTRAMRKLDVHNLATLTRRALELGVSSLDDKLTPAEARKAKNHAPPRRRRKKRGK